MGGSVYSTKHGKMCPKCGRPTAACACTKGTAGSSDGIVRVRRETKGRRGKTTTVVMGVPGDAAALAALAKDLKKRCGSGGTAKAGAIEIQGDHVDVVIAELRARDFTVKRAGG
jgi:translation initiation factor 1